MVLIILIMNVLIFLCGVWLGRLVEQITYENKIRRIEKMMNIFKKIK